jgi:drug/metabolite transporter (DMT)-like permease
VVRVAAQELLDSIRFPVAETEGAVKRLFRNLRQVIQSNRGNRRPTRRVTRGVGRRYAAMLGLVALVWGASFLFIKVADRDLSPSTLILGRLGLGALTLAAIVPFLVGGRRTVVEIRRNLAWLVVVALVNVALPFWLLSWGETRIDSGLASIIQAAVPIFNAVVAFGFFREVRVTGLRLVGVGLGFVGVALLVGAQPHGRLLGALAVVGMALCYAVGQLLAGRHLADVPPPVVALATTGIAALVALPAGAAQAPHHAPSWQAIGSVVALAVPGTAIAFLLFYAIISGAGAAFASLVTYLVPPIALGYGAIFLHEHVGAAALVGLALILGGVLLGAGRLRFGRRQLASEV